MKKNYCDSDGMCTANHTPEGNEYEMCKFYNKDEDSCCYEVYRSVTIIRGGKFYCTNAKAHKEAGTK